MLKLSHSFVKCRVAREKKKKSQPTKIGYLEKLERGWRQKTNKG